MRLITSRRSDVVGTPPTDSVAPGIDGLAVAGPTTEIAAEPICAPELIVHAELKLAGGRLVVSQPFGAGAPDGSIAAGRLSTGFWTAGRLRLDRPSCAALYLGQAAAAAGAVHGVRAAIAFFVSARA